LLVAQEQEYLVTQEDWQEVERQTRQNTQPRPKKRAKPKNRVKPIITLLLVFSMACLVVVRYAKISENHQKILEMEANLKKSYSVQDALKVELAEGGDLNNIEKVAKENLGMNYPAKGQIQIVQLPDNKQVSNKNSAGSNANRQHSIKDVFTRIISFLD
jgi:cell division protein FtsL